MPNLYPYEILSSQKPKESLHSVSFHGKLTMMLTEAEIFLVNARIKSWQAQPTCMIKLLRHVDNIISMQTKNEKIVLPIHEAGQISPIISRWIVMINEALSARDPKKQKPQMYLAVHREAYVPVYVHSFMETMIKWM